MVLSIVNVRIGNSKRQCISLGDNIVFCGSAMNHKLFVQKTEISISVKFEVHSVAPTFHSGNGSRYHPIDGGGGGANIMLQNFLKNCMELRQYLSGHVSEALPYIRHRKLFCNFSHERSS